MNLMNAVTRKTGSLFGSRPNGIFSRMILLRRVLKVSGWLWVLQ